VIIIFISVLKMSNIYITINQFNPTDQSIIVNYGTTVNETTFAMSKLGTSPSSGLLYFGGGIDLPQAFPNLPQGSSYDTVYVQAAGTDSSLDNFDYGYFTDDLGNVRGTSFGCCTSSVFGYFKDQDGSNGGTSFSVIRLNQVIFPCKIYMNFIEGAS
jgi:hypothetical protein